MFSEETTNPGFVIDRERGIPMSRSGRDMGPDEYMFMIAEVGRPHVQVSVLGRIDCSRSPVRYFFALQNCNGEHSGWLP
jgi:hypothetical protein